MVEKSLREKLSELVGSMLLSAAAVVAISLILVLAIGMHHDGPSPQRQFTWLALVSLAGAWGTLLPAKFWEGTEGEPTLRRFSMFVVGLGVGFVAYAADQWFLFSPVDRWGISGFRHQDYPRLYMTSGVPLLPAYLIYFGFLMLITRWWKQADPLRTSRVSVWPTAVCVFWAFALNLLWPFPQPWGFMAVATTSIAVQLASPWINPYRRGAARDAA